MNDNFLSNKELRKIKLKSFGKGVQISPNVTIIGAKNIQIGDNVRIDDYTIISAKEGYLKLASNIHIGGQCYLGCGGGIEISRNVNIAQGVKIYSKINDYINVSEKHKIIKGKVKISSNVIVGSNSVILGRCKISLGTTVGALSLVKKDLNPWSVYAGNPVRFIKKRKK
jgi:acetyltransferase-like isoleucine patch superfamily enzyme